MPYKLRKAPNKELYWVITIETGKKHSKLPIPLDKAKAQIRILETTLKGEVTGSGYYQENLRLRMRRFPDAVAEPIIRKTLPLLREVGPSRARLSRGRLFDNTERQRIKQRLISEAIRQAEAEAEAESELNRRMDRFPTFLADPIIRRTLPLLREANTLIEKKNLVDEAILQAEVEASNRLVRPVLRGSETALHYNEIPNGLELVDVDNTAKRGRYYNLEEWAGWLERKGRPFDPFTNLPVDPRNIEQYTAKIIPKVIDVKKYRGDHTGEVWFHKLDEDGKIIGEPSWVEPTLEELHPGQTYRPRGQTIEIQEQVPEQVQDSSVITTTNPAFGIQPDTPSGTGKYRKPKKCLKCGKFKV